MEEQPIPVLYGPPVVEYNKLLVNQKHFVEADNIIFDFGGVIMRHNMQGCINAFRKLTDEQTIQNVLGLGDNGEGVHDSLMQQYEQGLITTYNFLSRILSCCVAGTTENDVIEAWNSMHAGVPDGLWNVIANLREKGYRTFLLSNNNELHWRHTLSQYREQIDRCFFKVFLSHELHVIKPEPKFFDYVDCEIGAIAERTFFVDDIEENRRAANAYVGWNTCANIDELLAILAKR